MFLLSVFVRAAAIAVVPFLAWQLVTYLVSDPDEGANIGAGIVGGLILLASLVAAVLYAITATTRNHR